MPKTIRIIAALWFLFLVNYLDRVAISFAAPAIMESLSLTPADIGIVLSSFAIGYLLAQIPGGILADRYGAKRLLIIGPILWAIFTGATGLVFTVAGFVAVRILFGLSEGLSNSAFFKVIADNFDSKQRTRIVAICQTAPALATALAGPIAGFLLANYHWQILFFMMAIPAILAACGSFFLIPRDSQKVVDAGKTRTEKTESIQAGLRQPSLWFITIAYVGYSIAFWGYFGWMPSYLSIAQNINLESLGPLASIPFIFGFIGVLTGGFLGSSIFHNFRPQMLASCYALAGISLGIAYVATSLPLTLAGLSGAAFFMFGCQSATMTVLLDLSPPKYRGTFVGMFNTAGHIGAALAPASIGFLVNTTGSFAYGFGLMIAALCIATICMLAAVRFAKSRVLERC